MIRTALRGRILLAVLAVGLAPTLTACFGGDEDTEGPTTDTGGAGSNSVVTLAPPPPPVTPATVAAQPPPPTQPPAPPPQPPPPPTQGPGTTDVLYTIAEGDTLYSISRQFGISVDTLIEVNNISNPDVIRAGDTLVIPPPE